MRTSEAIAEFGSVAKLAAALGISVQAIYKWDGVVPALRAYQVRDLLAARHREAGQAAAPQEPADA